MHNSVRARLTLWYVAVLALVLVAFSAGVYTLMARATYERLDAGLRTALQVTSLSLSHEIEEHKGKQSGEESFRSVLATLHQVSFPLHAIAVFDRDRLVAAKPCKGGLVPAAGITAGATAKFADRGDLRVAAQTVSVAYTGDRYRIVVAEPLEAARDELRDLAGILFLGIPAALAVAALGGYLLARKSLAPVVAMSETVDRISSKNLGERVPVSNPGDELGVLAATFNRLLERLHAAFEQQRRFMADASHELRTPVTVARAAAEVTLERTQRRPEEYRDALQVIQEQMRRLTRVVQDLFTLARADSGAYALQKRCFYLDELIGETVSAARVLGVSKGVGVQTGNLAEAPCQADEGLIRQLILILLDNGIKYTPAGGQVLLGLERAGGRYRVTVADNGIGIPAEAQAHIFERFYRVEKARSRASADATGGGAGLGLSIARWIAEAHQGHLELVSSSSSGSTFRLHLPAPDDPGRRPASVGSAASGNRDRLQGA